MILEYLIVGENSFLNPLIHLLDGMEHLEEKTSPDVYDFYLDVTCIGGLNSIIKGNATLMK